MSTSLITHQAANLEQSLTEAIKKRTQRGLHGLHVLSSSQQVTIKGSAHSYHIAQLALAAAQRVLRKQNDLRPVRLAIDVSGAQ